METQISNTAAKKKNERTLFWGKLATVTHQGQAVQKYLVLRGCPLRLKRGWTLPRWNGLLMLKYQSRAGRPKTLCRGLCAQGVSPEYKAHDKGFSDGLKGATPS